MQTKQRILFSSIQDDSQDLLLGQSITEIAYADDLTVVNGSVADLWVVLNDMSATAETLGLRFNARKCFCPRIV